MFGMGHIMRIAIFSVPENIGDQEPDRHCSESHDS